MRRTRWIFGFVATLSLVLASGCVGEIVASHVGDDVDVDAGIDVEDPTVDGGIDDPTGDAGSVDDPDAAPPEFVWKAALMTGDDSIDAFDNALRHMYTAGLHYRVIDPVVFKLQYIYHTYPEASQAPLSGGVIHTLGVQIAAAF